MSWFSSTTTPGQSDDIDHLDFDRPVADKTTTADVSSVPDVRGQIRPGPGIDRNASVDARARVVGPSRSHRRVPLVSRGVPLALLGADVAALAVESLIVRGSVRYAFVFAALVLISRGFGRHYRRRLSLSVLDDLPRSLAAVVAAVGLSAVVLALVESGSPNVFSLVLRAGWFLLLALVGQELVTVVARGMRRRRGGRRTIVVGGGRVGDLLAEALVEHADLGLEPVGVLDPHRVGDDGTNVGAGGLPVLATDVRRLADTVVEHHIDTAILALEDGESHVDTVIALHQTGCETLLVPPMFEMHHDGPDVHRVRGVPLIQLRPDPTMRPSWWVKRGFDAAVAAAGLLVLAPLLLTVSVLILLDSGRPVMFWQERVGLDGRTFKLCKFRSMRPASETESQTQWNIATDPRVSRLGHILRRTSIDEIPQLWNILRGQMSLVGPRPERPNFVEQFTIEHERYWARHRVPVGLTGLAQVNGLRGDTSIRDRARFDNYYIANWSLWLDVKVMLLTVREVFGGRGR